MSKLIPKYFFKYVMFEKCCCSHGFIFLLQQILKYVEEDIVLSLNTRWLCLSSASAIWEPAFAELSLPDLILRKLLQVNLAPTDGETKRVQICSYQVIYSPKRYLVSLIFLPDIASYKFQNNKSLCFSCVQLVFA